MDTRLFPDALPQSGGKNYPPGRFVASALCALTAILVYAVPRAQAAFPQRTQVIELQKGWNAIYLEVEPTDTSPEAVFAGTPVDVAAQFTRHVRLGQFATDPGDLLNNRDSWAIWYAPDREESFLSGLHALHSHNAFLVHSKSAFQWRIAGQVYLKRIRWKADSFNLVGFPVNSEAAPTFGEYFRGIPAHAGQPVFRLTDGIWRKVETPDTTPMRRGEAYWVYSEGGSDYQGPCDVRLSFGDHLRYAPDRFYGSLTLRNRSPHPAGVTITRMDPEGIPLGFVFTGILETEIRKFTANLPESYRMPVMESGTNGSVTLRLGDTVAYQPGGSDLLRISSDSGTEYWISVYLDSRQ